MQSPWPENVYVLIPAYKAYATLQDFIPQLLKFVPINKICIVDDASMDDTGEFCYKMHLTYLSHPVNQGKGAALVTGFAFLMKKKARWIITMDADGQHAPEDLNNFISFVTTHPQTGICIGTRCKKIGKMPFPRILSNRITSKLLSWICGQKILDCQCGYRAYSSELLKQISFEYNRFEMESEVIMKASKLGFPVSFVDVQTLYLNGQSHIAHFKDTFRWVKAVIKIWLKQRRISGQNSATNAPE
jgi:glycosyltransferase involved in cell wall biosynthesis